MDFWDIIRKILVGIALVVVLVFSVQQVKGVVDLAHDSEIACGYATCSDDA